MKRKHINCKKKKHLTYWTFILKNYYYPFPHLPCVYLLFAELPDRQDVLADQWVQQRRHLEVGQLSSRNLTCSRLRG